MIEHKTTWVCDACGKEEVRSNDDVAWKRPVAGWFRVTCRYSSGPACVDEMKTLCSKECLLKFAEEELHE